MQVKLAGVRAFVLLMVVGPAAGFADKRVQANSALSSQEDPTQVRVRELIYVLRQHRAFARSDEWGGAIRELTKIGPAALPELLLELKQTERGVTMRGLLFTLRAINDPRALPFVIEALPKAERLSTPNFGSDYGMSFVDPELHKFMHDHSNYPRGEEESAGYGRPINEILGTLHKLSGTALPDLEKGPEPSWNANYWRKWWKEKQDAGTAPARDKSLELAPRKEDLVERDGVRKFGPLFPTGPDQHLSPVAEVVLGNKTIADSPSVFDFETGRTFEYREGIRFGPEKKRWVDYKNWEKRSGVDLDAQEGCDLHVWRIDNRRWDSLDEEVRSSKKFDVGREAYANWLLGNPPTAHQIQTFLFTTREGSRGVLRVHRSPGESLPRFEYRLWNHDSNKVVVRPVAPSGKIGEWQAAKIAILKEPDFGNRCLFSFARGESVELSDAMFAPGQPPKMATLRKEKGAVLVDEKIAKWARDKGIDVASVRSQSIGEGGPTRPTEEMDLTLRDARYVQVSPEAFEKLTVARAKDILSRYPDFYPMSYLLSSPGGNGSQATYLFETKLGFMGLINILHVREDLSSISFQYKLASETMKGGDAAK